MRGRTAGASLAVALLAVTTGSTEDDREQTSLPDGWTRVTIGDDGVRRTGSGESLAWTPDEGFSGGPTFDE